MLGIKQLFHSLVSPSLTGTREYLQFRSWWFSLVSSKQQEKSHHIVCVCINGSGLHITLDIPTREY